MFVRRTQTRATANGERYFTHRLVCSERSGTRVQQRTLLNLGRHFALPQADWPLLCSCVKQILSSQYALPLAEVPREIEQTAQHIAAQLLVRQVELPGAAKSQGNAAHREFHSIDVDSLELLRPRSVGVEQLGLWAMEQVQLLPLLNRLGLGVGLELSDSRGSNVVPGHVRRATVTICHAQGGSAPSTGTAPLPVVKLVMVS